MIVALRAGVAYFLIVFAAGFTLGTIRTLFIIPRLGETSAVLLELPVMLAMSWVVCLWLVRRFAVPYRTVNRLVMGGVAFALVLSGELGVSVFGFGRTVAEHFSVYLSVGAQLGLAAQLGFAMFPLVQAVTNRSAA